MQGGNDVHLRLNDLNIEIAHGKRQIILYPIAIIIVAVLSMFEVSESQSDKYYTPRSAAMDSTQILMLSVSYIERGLQEGDFHAALKRFSNDYCEAGRILRNEEIADNMRTISALRLKESKAGIKNAGIYLILKDISFSQYEAAGLICATVFTHQNEYRVSHVSTKVIFRRYGGAWLLSESDGFLSKIIEAYRIMTVNNESDSIIDMGESAK